MTNATATQAGKSRRVEKPAAKKRRGGVTGWVPNQHGAWVMVTLPLVIGLCYAGSLRGLPILVPLVIAWYTGYFAFFAFGLWAKAAAVRKAQYVTPLLVYGGICAAASIAVLAQAPHLLWWAAAFGPLVAIAAFEAIQKRPRSLASGISTVIAAALMVPVAVDAVSRPITPHMMAVTGLLAMYFSAMIPFVKTLIRNRGDQRYVIGSIVAHAVALVITGGLVYFGYLHWFTAVAMGAALVRAWWMPWQVARTGKRFSPKFVGNFEVIFTVAVVIGIALAP
ncbi:YwiC-like family protein [Corynebacterium choanae]|uniref:YwiC-like protein n=1 Tax=Corynebacterium choanae TaxID=1862358 RepID=A0A3G6J7V3_9CORY|nr:YwiC-like family protein [Corynebacterium choanae]AZA14185.1 hypothetical protein CCHOA_09010 [Corynebacterium choanae]